MNFVTVHLHLTSDGTGSVAVMTTVPTVCARQRPPVPGTYPQTHVEKESQTNLYQ